VFGWLFLRGRARCCGRGVSIRYPAIELLTALLFAACWIALEPAHALAVLPLVAGLIAATFIDIDHMIIPDRFSIGGAVFGVVLSCCVPALHGAGEVGDIAAHLRSGFDAVLGALVGSGVLLWIGLLAEKILRREAMGFGDVKLMGAIGAFLGWQGALIAIFGGACLGCVALAGVVIWRNLRPRKDAEATVAQRMANAHVGLPSGPGAPGVFGRETPFGPMLAAGALVYLLLLRDGAAAYYDVLHDLLLGW
jgi:leader peptidase (prepilin peptidase)/N-methyltransferase